MNDVEIKQNLQRAFGGKLISEIKEIQQQKKAEKKPSKKAKKNAPKTPKKTAKKTK